MLNPTENMRTILFMDDWAVLARLGIDRRWFPAEPWPGLAPWQDKSLVYQSVLRSGRCVNGQLVKLFLELEQARLYAVRVDADLLYGFVPELNLAGDYIPEKCY
jgi:hypothetical protein